MALTDTRRKWTPGTIALALALSLLGAACGDAARGAQPPPPDAVLAPARVRAVVDSYLAAFNTRDRELYLSLFAERATVEDPAGSAPLEGREALAAFFDAATARGGLELELLPDLVRVSGNHVAFVFRLRLEIAGTWFEMRPIDTFDLDGDARIVAMRAYWGPEHFRPAP